jgi:DNA mismatch repair ATPase MutS
MEQNSATFPVSINEFEEKIQAETGHVRLILWLRLALFLGMVVLFLLLIKSKPVLAFAALGLTVACFLFLLKKETRSERKIAYLHNRIRIRKQELALHNKQFEGFAEGKEFMDKQHDYLSDLDIFGRRSVFQFLNRTATFTGKKYLADWLTYPLGTEADIRKRQGAVMELAGKQEWCESFLALAYENRVEDVDKEVISDWLQEKDRFSTPLYKFLVIFLPFCCLLSLGLYLGGLLGYGLLQICVLLNAIVSIASARVITQIHDKLGRKFSSIEKYKKLITKIQGEDFESEELVRLKLILTHGDSDALNVLGSLNASVNALDARMNLIMAIILNGLLLWDIHAILRIERWRRTYRKEFLEWIAVVGEIDALVSLGLFSKNNPAYTFPEISSGAFEITAKDLGHPLIQEQVLVRNDYELSGGPAIDLLTGANMAGKSTFLRTLGVNLVLAMCGAPVCATRFRFSPVKLFTSLRTADSLQENESFFYAELKRLHQLIQYYEQGEVVFFLLDEILKGTNSKDQHGGSEALIRKLLRMKGEGIIATHDVELSGLQAAYPQNIRNLCFEIEIEQDKLKFDYKLKSGVCRTMNASFLMKKMGIADFEENK